MSPGLTRTFPKLEARKRAGLDARRIFGPGTEGEKDLIVTSRTGVVLGVCVISQ